MRPTFFAIIFVFGTSLVAMDSTEKISATFTQIQTILKTIESSLKTFQEIKTGNDNDENSPIAPFITDFIKFNPMTMEQVLEVIGKKIAQSQPLDGSEPNSEQTTPLCFFSPLPFDAWKQEIDMRLKNKINLAPYEAYLNVLYNEGVLNLARYNNQRAETHVKNAFYRSMTHKEMPPLFIWEFGLIRQVAHILVAIEEAIENLKNEPDPAMLPSFTYEKEETVDSCTIM
jgi:hypothetical protein